MLWHVAYRDLKMAQPPPRCVRLFSEAAGILNNSVGTHLPLLSVSIHCKSSCTRGQGCLMRRKGVRSTVFVTEICRKGITVQKSCKQWMLFLLSLWILQKSEEIQQSENETITLILQPHVRQTPAKFHNIKMGMQTRSLWEDNDVYRKRNTVLKSQRACSWRRQLKISCRELYKPCPWDGYNEFRKVWPLCGWGREM
jgi:hypothetical protein